MSVGPAGFNPGFSFNAFSEGKAPDINGLIDGLNSSHPSQAVQTLVTLHHQQQQREAKTGQDSQVNGGTCGCGLPVSSCGCQAMGGVVVTDFQTMQPLTMTDAVTNRRVEQYVDGATTDINHFADQITRIWNNALGQ